VLRRLPMSPESLAALCQYLAEQSYMNTLLVRKLVGHGILQPGEMQLLFEDNPEEREEFYKDFLKYLASIGLKSQ
jgi:hypothetical protein